MKTIFFTRLLSLLCLVSVLFSCSSENISYVEDTEVDSIKNPDVEVSTIGKWINFENDYTRGTLVDMNEPVLHFKNEVAFNRVVGNLINKSDEECVDYLKKLGFNGALTQLIKADNELEKIFDTDDPILFQRLVSEYKAKYKDKFLFNPKDTFDITPNLKFNDERLMIVGNIDGMVVIGNKLIQSNSVSNYTRAFPNGPIEPGFRASTDATLTIKHRKYKSSMTLGRIINGNSMAVEFTTTKKILFWKKRVRAEHHASLSYNGGPFIPVYCPARATVTILNIPTDPFSPTYSAEVRDFKSSKVDNVGNAIFRHIILL